MASIDETLRTRFGLAFLFPFQRLVVSNILDPERRYDHQIVVLPTGAGKSLCFTLPAVLLPGITLIVYPLLSLMADQERRMRERNIPVVTIRGGQSRSERIEIERAVQKTAPLVVVTNPESLAIPGIRKLLGTQTVSLAVVDEAHCVSQWGDSFRPAYRTLGAHFQEISAERITAFTATASDAVVSAIRERIFPDGAHLIRANVDRPNIHYALFPAAAKCARIVDLLHERPRPAIVFCGTRRAVEEVAYDLGERLPTVPVRFYHAGLARSRKAEIESWFFSNSDGVLVATCAYGMGVDKPDIRHVIHHDLPSSIEAYLQESGRAGRDREEAFASIVYDPATDLAGDSPLRELLLQNVCRRRLLSHLIGFEQEECTGCDVCDGTVVDSDPLAESILALIGRFPGRFTAQEAALRLAPRGLLHEDIQVAINSLIGNGVLIAGLFGGLRYRPRNFQSRGAITSPPRKPVIS